MLWVHAPGYPAMGIAIFVIRAGNEDKKIPGYFRTIAIFENRAERG
jgi:hypothetical protein